MRTAGAGQRGVAARLLPRRIGTMQQRQRALLLPAALLSFLLFLPILYVAMQAREVGWHTAAGLIFRPRVYDLLVNTLALDVFVTVVCVAIGVTAAWFTERTDLPGRRLWNVLVTLPFAVPAFVSGYSWISVFPGLEGFNGAMLVLSTSYYPLVYLPVAAALKRMDPALEEVALSLGYSRLKVFLRVILPYLRPAIIGGGVLVALHILAEFGALAFVNYDTFTTAIFDQYELAFNSASAAMLTFVLLILCFIVLGLAGLIQGGFSYATVRKGVSGRAERVRLAAHAPWVLLAFTVLVVFAIGIPFASLVYWLLTGSSAAFHWQEIAAALYSTITLGLGGSVLAVLFAIPLVILAVRHSGVFATIADRLPYFIHSLPGLVVGLTLVFFTVRSVNWLYQTVPVLLLAYAMLYLPLAQSSIRGVLVQVPRQLEEVAGSLGKKPLAIFSRVTLPLIWPGVGAGFALVCLKVMSELTATLILRPTGVDTLATRVWEHTTNIEYAASAPYAMLLILISGLPVYLLTMRLSSIRAPHHSDT